MGQIEGHQSRLRNQRKAQFIKSEDMNQNFMQHSVINVPKSGEAPTKPNNNAISSLVVEQRYNDITDHVFSPMSPKIKMLEG
jgi:hypothetical protein